MRHLAPTVLFAAGRGTTTHRIAGWRIATTTWASAWPIQGKTSGTAVFTDAAGVATFCPAVCPAPDYVGTNICSRGASGSPGFPGQRPRRFFVHPVYISRRFFYIYPQRRHIDASRVYIRYICCAIYRDFGVVWLLRAKGEKMDESLHGSPIFQRVKG